MTEDVPVLFPGCTGDVGVVVALARLPGCAGLRRGLNCVCKEAAGA
ncbi:hypothetical protein BN2475_720071 [Paraburkholderia ribeironis]|uniref:Uncharacterized protein n=1 Tax=Paraburkholderia ribeironis TaxID=1247936 RepID=A0A1N7SJ37_9BURK|nr:hypothetical protein BN2475_720071 [Paraburkholderia ribeironis]